MSSNAKKRQDEGLDLFAYFERETSSSEEDLGFGEGEAADVSEGLTASRKVEVYSVSELTERIKSLLEGEFFQVWVSGEISNLSRPKSGHLYFTLKDEKAQMSAVMWRSFAQRVPFEVSDGQKVLAKGKVSVYPSRGNYQILVETLEPQGMGALQLAFEQLKKRLGEEGLFDPAHKKPIPRFPQRVGLLTSATGAAIQDMLRTLYQDFTLVEVYIYPVAVQGEEAKYEIVRAIEDCNRWVEEGKLDLDLLIVGRGGGSLEDLWAFNEELVARAIFASKIPIISAVGHEVDFSISDFVADRRALTPTAAAQMVMENYRRFAAALPEIQNRLQFAARRYLQDRYQRFIHLVGRPCFQQPLDFIRFLEQRLDEFAGRLDWPWEQVQRRYQQVLEHIGSRLNRLGEQFFQLYEPRLKALGGKLEALCPQKVLRRGYSIVEDGDGRPVYSVEDLSEGQGLRIKFRDGEAEVVVQKILGKKDCQ
ncbi:MAG: exodeoxyribonuclease VII large subunit [Planctomycetota bacterium]|nr:MAG: exodeoxyribonuclease VII large subunit [Planctomycetota bacterium]